MPENDFAPDAQAEPVAVHAVVSGFVQGVAFRAFTRDMARTLGLSGWVRNLPDGRVECEAQGPPEAVLKFIDFLHQGSPIARVTGVEVRSHAFDPGLQRFEIRR